MASQITSPVIAYSTVYSGTDPKKHQSSASLAFVWGFHPWPVKSPHKGPVTRKVFPFDDVIMSQRQAKTHRSICRCWFSVYSNTTKTFSTFILQCTTSDYFIFFITLCCCITSCNILFHLVCSDGISCPYAVTGAVYPCWQLHVCYLVI